MFGYDYTYYPHSFPRVSMQIISSSVVFFLLGKKTLFSFDWIEKNKHTFKINSSVNMYYFLFYIIPSVK